MLQINDIHIYQGNCQDAVNGPHSRDNNCPVCLALIAFEQSAQQANAADLPHLGPLMEGASSAAPKPVTSSAKLQSAD